MSSVIMDTPLAEALSSTIHQRIVKESWTTEDDTALAEYITLMVANNKTQDQVASELAGELLQEAQGTAEFARWLFDQVASLSGDQAPSEVLPPTTAAALEPSNEHMAEADQSIPAAYDADMGDSAPDNAPKGPRGMQSSRGSRGQRGSLPKPDSALHRVRGNDRINSHVRGAPKGPRNSSNTPIRPGMQKALNNLTGPPQQSQQMPMMPNGMQPGQQMAALTPDQQIQYMKMFEESAQMMAQMMGMNAQGMPQQLNGGPSRPLFDRVERGRGSGIRGARGRGAMHQNGTPRSSIPTTGDQQEGNPSTDSHSVSQVTAVDPFTIMCKFNTRCSNTTCPYVHQSPAAPLNTPVDMNQTCSFGVTCKNQGCIARHPSPANKSQHQAQEQCKFWPNCKNHNCPFRHPQAKLCQFGASCKNKENCLFTHLETPCHYNPCTNAKCPYKHAPGQNRGYDAYVWTPGQKTEEQKDADHLSDRKFVDGDAGPEELVKPEGVEQNGNGNGNQNEKQEGTGEVKAAAASSEVMEDAT